MPVDYEHKEQAALFEWAVLLMGRFPELDLMYAIPNGAKRDKATAARLKAEGVKAGMPDICLPVARGGCHAFYLELKAIYPDGTSGQPSQEQLDKIEELKAEGNRADVFYGWHTAAEAIENYLSG